MSRTRKDINFDKLRTVASQTIATGEVSKIFMSRAMGYEDPESINKFLNGNPIPYNKVTRLCSLLGLDPDDFRLPELEEAFEVVAIHTPEAYETRTPQLGQEIADAIREVAESINKLVEVYTHERSDI